MVAAIGFLEIPILQPSNNEALLYPFMRLCDSHLNHTYSKSDQNVVNWLNKRAY